MGLADVARKTHWAGVALLFIASILLLFTTISAPIMNSVSLLHVRLTNETQIRHSSYSFGTFGYCVLDVPPINTQQDWCTKRHIGYEPADLVAKADKTDFSHMASGTSDALTRVMVLHPIVCGLTFIAFLASIGGGVFGSLAGAFVAFVAWVLTLVSLAVDFSLFGIIRHHVNTDGSGSKASFGSAIWLLLVSFVLQFFGILIVFLTCCASHREKKRSAAATKNEGYPPGAAAPRKKRFGIF